MIEPPIRFLRPVTLVGGGALNRGMIEEARRIAPDLIAADGAADRLAALGYAPAAVVGDMDSLADPDRWRSGPVPFVEIAEQNSTDFEKCLGAIDAPVYLAAGFTGRRVDHMLAAFHALLSHMPKVVTMIGEEEVIALMPPGRVLRFDLAAGARVSFFPLLSATGTYSAGLVWPIDGLNMAPGRQIGTSNAAAAARVEVGFDGPGVLVMLERAALGTLVAALSEGSATA
ncbi:MAG: thiamine diphosphokinase [Pseudomonadota bacterium]